MKSLLRSASREGRRSTRIVLSPRGGFHRGGKKRPSSSLVGVKRTAGRGPVHTSGPLYEANITWPARAFLSLSRSERPVAYSTTTTVVKFRSSARIHSRLRAFSDPPRSESTQLRCVCDRRLSFGTNTRRCRSRGGRG